MEEKTMLTNERKCPGCNAVVGDDSKFCPNCGANLENQEVQPASAKATIFCPNCGAQIDEDSVFCPECGNRIALPINEQVNANNTDEKLPKQEAGITRPDNLPNTGVQQNEPFLSQPEKNESGKAKKKSPLAKILISVSVVAAVFIAAFAGFLF